MSDERQEPRLECGALVVPTDGAQADAAAIAPAVLTPPQPDAGGQDHAHEAALMLGAFNACIADLYGATPEDKRPRVVEDVKSVLGLSHAGLFNKVELEDDGRLPVHEVLANLRLISAHRRLELLYTELARVLRAMLNITRQRLPHTRNATLHRLVRDLGVPHDLPDPVDAAHNPRLIAYS